MWIANDGAAHRDALALATGELSRIAIEKLGQTEDLGRALDARIDLGFALFGKHQGKRHVVAHGHVRIQRIVLEHHGDVALFGSNSVDDSAADVDFAFADFLETRDHPQQRRLAAARRANQHTEFAVRDFDVDAANDVGRTETLMHGRDSYRCHLPPSMPLAGRLDCSRAPL